MPYKIVNHLRQEKSPYLLQHKDNPVAWFAWGQEAFQAARELDRPIFLSIGYSTCYWCHVMEHDSFESEEVASLLNDHFISIKVDREERPDVDQIYMDAVVGISGHGGWPMSVFLTPDRKPFFGGTFFPKQQFIPLLKKIDEVWQSDRQSILTSADQIFTFLNAKAPASEGKISLKDSLSKAFSYYAKSFDTEFGGFGSAPKFPQPNNLELLLRLWRRTGKEEALFMVEKTLDQICRGGIYDHVGGGFHRYATDRMWLTPHFEKMLYDNAQLVNVLLHAYQATKTPHYLKKAADTLDYCLRDLALLEGGFASAEDAGEVGEEGEFYVWESAELEHTLSEEEYDLLSKLFTVSDVGNFENHKNILSLQPETKFEEIDNPKIQEILAKLNRLRSARERPLRDNKVLTSWMALLISAFAEGYAVTGDERFLSAALKAERFQREKLSDGRKLLRRFCDNDSRFPGFLEDYSYLIQALIDLYQVSGEASLSKRALELQDTQDELFWDFEKGGYFFATSELTELIVRKKDFNDGATPSGNSVSAMNLLRLFQLSGDSKYLDRYRELVTAMAPFAEKYPTAYATFICALDYEHENFRSVVASEKTWKQTLRTLKQEFLPNMIIAKADPKGPTLVSGKDEGIYICDAQGCMPPETDVESIKEKLSQSSQIKI